jgi:hypothetical protein
MVERPSYVPRTWTRGALNRRFWSSPKRVFAWLVVTPFGFVAVAALQFMAGDAILGVLFAVGAGVSGAQAAIYAPRALRAVRSAGRTNNRSA